MDLCTEIAAITLPKWRTLQPPLSGLEPVAPTEYPPQSIDSNVLCPLGDLQAVQRQPAVGRR